MVHRACVDGDRGGRKSLSLSDRGVLCVYRTTAYDRVKTDRKMEICIGGTDGRSGKPVGLESRRHKLVRIETYFFYSMSLK